MLNNKSLTLFHTDHTEKQALQPIADEAQTRGWQIEFTDNIKQKAEVGIYCQHPPCYPENSKLSVIILHGLDQGRNVWPNLWQKEPWNKFDIGILPGKEWSKRWQQSSWDPYSRTRLGVYELGWPKADIIYKNKSEYDRRVAEIREKLNLKYKHSVLYALAFETDGKQNDFVQALKDQPVNLLLKSWLTEADAAHYSDLYNNQQEMNEIHKNIENAYILDPRMSIMYCLGISDIFVTDESSILFESLLLNVPSISVSDWPMATSNSGRRRFPNIPYPFVKKLRKTDLHSTVAEMLENLEVYKAELEKKKDDVFSYLGCSSIAIMDLLEGVLNKDYNLKHPPLTAMCPVKNSIIYRRIFKAFIYRNFYLRNFVRMFYEPDKIIKKIFSR